MKDRTKTAERYLVRSATIVLGVALTWIAAFSFNEWVFPATMHSLRANWIFLPASIRLLAVLLFDELGAVGLTVGAFVTAWGGVADDLAFNLGLAISSGLAPLASVSCCRRLMKVGPDLAGLRPLNIMCFSVASAFANALLLNGYLGLVGRLHSDIGQIGTVLVGDVLGTAIVLLVLSNLLTFALPKRR